MSDRQIEKGHQGVGVMERKNAEYPGVRMINIEILDAPDIGKKVAMGQGDSPGKSRCSGREKKARLPVLILGHPFKALLQKSGPFRSFRKGGFFGKPCKKMDRNFGPSLRPRFPEPFFQKQGSGSKIFQCRAHFGGWHGVIGKIRKKVFRL